MLTLKHLKTLRHVSILIDHHQGVRRCLVTVTEFKKSMNLKFLKVSHGDVAAKRLLCVRDLQCGEVRLSPTYLTTLNVTHT